LIKRKRRGEGGGGGRQGRVGRGREIILKDKGEIVREIEWKKGETSDGGGEEVGLISRA
jgi:hypothetical protein